MEGNGLRGKYSYRLRLQEKLEQDKTLQKIQQSISNHAYDVGESSSRLS
jgi:hypothetical protein